MGFGAGFKHRDKEKDKTKQFGKDHDKQRINSVKRSKSKDEIRQKKSEQKRIP